MSAADDKLAVVSEEIEGVASTESADILADITQCIPPSEFSKTLEKALARFAKRKARVRRWPVGFSPTAIPSVDNADIYDRIRRGWRVTKWTYLGLTEVENYLNPVTAKEVYDRRTKQGWVAVEWQLFGTSL